MSDLGLTTDHSGKVSQGSVVALLGTASACLYALAPMGAEIATGQALQSDVDWNTFAMLLMGPNGYMLWQKISAPQERLPKT